MIASNQNILSFVKLFNPLTYSLLTQMNCLVPIIFFKSKTKLKLNLKKSCSKLLKAHIQCIWKLKYCILNTELE